MRSLAQWIADYQVCHNHPTNRLIHHICVPAIMFSLLGLLWPINLPLDLGLPDGFINVATLLVVLVLIYYFMLSWRIALGMLVLVTLMLGAVLYLWQMGMLLEISLSVFVVAWLGQFIGHHIEGKRPSFFEDLRFLLIGPLWVLVHLYEYLGIPTAKGSG